MITDRDVIGIEQAADQVIRQMNEMSSEDARQFSTEWLIDTGVLDENGNDKKQIVNGDFFGW